MTPSPVTPPDEGLLFRLFTPIVTGFLGWLVALVTFRIRLQSIDTTLAKHEKQLTDMHNDHTVELTRLRLEINKRHEENQTRQNLTDRRQMFTLRLVADVARKLGTDKRVDDVVIEFLTSDNGDEG
jgi:hypothetical protein